MRRLASFLLLGIALSAGAAEIWRWKDANGVVHYSDSPVPGAERVSVGSAPKPGAPIAAKPQDEDPPDPEPLRYTRCEFTNPANDTVFNTADSVTAVLVVEPGLQGVDHIQVNLDGGVLREWPGSGYTYTFKGLFRGAHTLTALVKDANDRVLCTGPTLTFHMRQPTLLSPARQQPAPTKPPVKPPVMGPSK